MAFSPCPAACLGRPTGPFPSLSLCFLPTNVTEKCLVKNPYPNLPQAVALFLSCPFIRSTSSEKKPTYIPSLYFPQSTTTLRIQLSSPSFQSHLSRRHQPALDHFNPWTSPPFSCHPRCSDHLLEETLTQGLRGFLAHSFLQFFRNSCLPQGHF